jgi:hypothetical protein
VSIAVSLFAATAAFAQPVETAEQAAPTPIEQALMEHVCSVVPAGGGPESDRYLACMRTQLFSLRTDFGKDLGRLSASERKAIDAACNEIRAASGREPYLDCLGQQLTILRAKRRVSAPLGLPVAPPPSEVNAGVVAAAPAATPVPSGSSHLFLGGGVLVMLLAGAGGFVFMKTRRVSHKCRTCGDHVEAAGELCQKCRHEAAEAVRRAVAERAEQQRSQEEEEKRLKEQAAQEARERAHKAQEAQQAAARRQRERDAEEARKREAEERQQQEQAARERQMTAGVPDHEFDPYEVLEIAPGAGADEIRAAYETARDKSDPDQVAHLGVEVQEHFRRRSQAVERAFRMLAS